MTGAPPDVDHRDALAQRLLAANVATYEVACVYVGDRLGLYRALDELGVATAEEVAGATGTHERYVREWLEQQAVAGILDVEDARADPGKRLFRIPRGHRAVLLDRDDLGYLAPLARFTVGVLGGLPRLLEAFQTGGGVEYATYGADAREGQADVNRTMFVNLLGSAWLPAVRDVHERLVAEPPARVADIGCGTGWSSIAIARAYPHVRVDGVDLDGPSVALARTNARAEGVDDRVRFIAGDAADPFLAGRYDLVTIFEALHDMARPVEALRAARGLLAPDGSVLVADERCAETFEPRGPLSERLFYGWSVLFCLPTSLAEQPSAALGTALRPATVERLAREAGFARFEVLPIEHDLWRFYRLTNDDR